MINQQEKRYPILGSTFMKLIMGGLLLLSALGFVACFFGTACCEMNADIFFQSTPEQMLATVIGNPDYYNTTLIGVSAAKKIFLLVHQLKYFFLPLTVFFGLLTVGCFVYLMAAAGRRRYTNEVVPSFLTAVPPDLLLLVTLAVSVLSGGLLRNILVCMDYLSVKVALILLSGALYAVALILLAMDFAIRLKMKKWWKNTVIYRVFHLIVRGFKLIFGHLPIFIKAILFTGLLFGYLVFVMLLQVAFGQSFLSIFLFLAGWTLFFWMVFYFSVLLYKLLRGSAALAKGHLNEKISTAMMFGDLKKGAENLNSIGEGMNLAVEERMKSERFRTELITNVSHDIKTPLTSIINYADLISKAETNEQTKEYAEVLSRQSLKLKRLMEDLIEASKAANGMVHVQLAPIESAILLGQVAGEYTEKLREHRLELILQQENCTMSADGRLMWRILDNLMNNAFKYAQEGTRVYLGCKPNGKYAEITLRNTSREQLNISAEELMERFVRADGARSTEGNGLGLSIARSFTELQSGRFEVGIDGDLFKVTVSIPLQ